MLCCRQCAVVSAMCELQVCILVVASIPFILQFCLHHTVLLLQLQCVWKILTRVLYMIK